MRSIYCSREKPSAVDYIVRLSVAFRRTSPRDWYYISGYRLLIIPLMTDSESKEPDRSHLLKTEPCNFQEYTSLCVETCGIAVTSKKHLIAGQKRVSLIPLYVGVSRGVVVGYLCIVQRLSFKHNLRPYCGCDVLHAPRDLSRGPAWYELPHESRFSFS